MKSLSMAALAALAAALTGCYGGGYYHNWNGSGYGTQCVPPSNAQLVYPSNNATGVPDNTMTIYIAVPTALSRPNVDGLNLIGPPSYGAQLTSGFTAVSYGSIPTPNTVPSYSNPQYYSATLSYGLTAASSFNVHWNQLNSGCSASGSDSLLGSFTTQ